LTKIDNADEVDCKLDGDGAAALATECCHVRDPLTDTAGTAAVDPESIVPEATAERRLQQRAASLFLPKPPSSSTPILRLIAAI
jgi:hypothetical protein